MKKERYDRILEPCFVCGNKARSRWKNGNAYCQRHYMQLYNNGKILDRTIYDKNEWVIYKNHAECITYDKNLKENGIVIFDLDDVDKFKDKKIHITNKCGKYYALLSIKSKKFFIHRILLGIENNEYNIKQVVDHINGNSLDNRKCNLRLCTHSENMKNIRKPNKVIGVSYKKSYDKYIARIMNNYKTENLGLHKTFEDAVYARIVREYELCGEYGPNREFFQYLKDKNPIEKIKHILDLDYNNPKYR